MTSDEYRTALKTLGLSQTAAGYFLGVHDVTSRRWAERGPPNPVAKMLRLMLALKFTPAYVNDVLGDKT